MNIFKIKRLENEIKKKIYIILYKKINDKRIKNMNISYIKISSDYSIAKIFVFSIKNDFIENNIKILNKSSNFFRKEIFKSLNLKFIPKLLFIYDSNIIKSIKLINLIDNINNNYE